MRIYTDHCAAVRQWGSAQQCTRQCAAVQAAKCGSAHGSVRAVRAHSSSVRQSVHLVVYSSARCSARQCGAVRAAVCGSAHGSMRAVHGAVCGSALCSVWQCARQGVAMRQCGIVQQCAAVLVAVCASVRGSVRQWVSGCCSTQ
jgi:hypothetical protein